ncbi:MAG: OmpH family outer membrane protein [Paracoccaceae bacterium]
MPRRRLLCLLAAVVLGQHGEAQANDIVMVSRDRLLRESEAANLLGAAEERMTRQLQASVDEAKAQLAAEEAELTKLRATLEPEAFEVRAKDFDRRIRAVRREAQERAAFLQRGFQEARASIVAALPGILERVRVELGVDVVLNADNVLAAAAGIDVTDQVVALIDAEGPRPPPPKIDLSLPLLAPRQSQSQDDQTGGQTDKQ